LNEAQIIGDRRDSQADGGSLVQHYTMHDQQYRETWRRAKQTAPSYSNTNGMASMFIPGLGHTPIYAGSIASITPGTLNGAGLQHQSTPLRTAYALHRPGSQHSVHSTAEPMATGTPYGLLGTQVSTHQGGAAPGFSSFV
jgi:hypothetical protein